MPDDPYTLTLGPPSIGTAPPPQPSATPSATPSAFDPDAFIQSTRQQQVAFNPDSFLKQMQQSESSFNPDEFLKNLAANEPSLVLNSALQGDTNIHPAQIAVAEQAQRGDQSPQELLVNGTLNAWKHIPDAWHHIWGAVEDASSKLWNAPLEWHKQLVSGEAFKPQPPEAIPRQPNAYMFAKTGDPAFAPLQPGETPPAFRGPEAITEFPAAGLKVGEAATGLTGKLAELQTPYPTDVGSKAWWAQAAGQLLPLGPYIAPEIGKKVAEATGEATEAQKKQYKDDLNAIATTSDIVRQHAMNWANQYQKYMNIDPNSAGAQFADNAIWFLVPSLGPEAELAGLLESAVARSARWTLAKTGLVASKALPTAISALGAGTTDVLLKKYLGLPEGTAAAIASSVGTGDVAAAITKKGGLGTFLSNALHKVVVGQSPEDFQTAMRALVAHGDMNIVDALQYQAAQDLNAARQEVVNLRAAGKDTTKAETTVAELKAKHDGILNQRKSQQFLEDVASRMASTAVHTGIGGMAGAALGYGGAPTGEEAQGIAGGMVGGASLMVPFAAYGAWRGLRNNRAAYGAAVYREAGTPDFKPDFAPLPTDKDQREAAIKDRDDIVQLNGLIRLTTQGSAQGQRQVFVLRDRNLLNAMREQAPEYLSPGTPVETPPAAAAPQAAPPPGAAPVPPPVPPELLPLPEHVAAQLPNGFVGKDGNLYLNGDRIHTGVGFHEMRHVSQMMGSILREASPELMERFGNVYDSLRGIPNPGARGFVLMPETRSTPEYLRAERDADIGRLVLQDKPLGLLYGGERPGDIAANWARQLVNGYLPNKVNIDPLLGTPVTGHDRIDMLRQLYRDGALAQRNRFLREPVQPSAPAAPAPGGAPAPHPFDPFGPEEKAIANQVLAIANDPRFKGTPLGLKITPENIAGAIQEAKDNGVEVNFQNIASRVMQGPSQAPPRPQPKPIPGPQPPPVPVGGGAPGVPPAEPAPVTHPDYGAIRTQAEDAMRQKLAGSKAKDVEAKIGRAGIEAAAQAHAKVVGPDSDLITWRTDKFGKSSIWGRVADPNDPFHQMLIERAGLNTPEMAQAKENLNNIESNIGRTIAIDYSHAPGEGDVTREAREGARAVAGAPQRVAEEVPREKLTKSFVPTGIRYSPKSNVFIVDGFSPDKLLTNANTVIGYANEKGLRTYGGVNDPLLAQHIQQMTENHQNGFDAGGRPIKGTALTPVEQTPGYKPHVIPKDYRDQLNVMMGNDTAKTGVKGLSAEQAEKQLMAKQNSPYFDPATGETNKLRAQMGDRAKELSPVYETLRPELIDRVRQAPVEDEQTLRPSGFTGDRGQFGLRGLPRQEFTAAGLMPATAPEARLWQPTREEIEQGRAGARIGAPGMWDKVQTSGQADELAKQLGVNPAKRFYEQKPEARQKISDYFRRFEGAQYMPATAGFYTKSGRAIEEKMGKSADSDQIKALIRNAGVGKNEMEWLGLNDLPKGKMTKDEVQQWITAHTPELSVTTLGGKGQLSTQLENYIEGKGRRTPSSSREWADLQNQLENDAARNYIGSPEYEHYIALAREANDFRRGIQGPAQRTQYLQYTLPGGENYREILINLPYVERGAGSYRSPHFAGDQATNLLGHLRVDDRTTLGGNNMRFIEEAQSDWAQAGRRLGFDTPATRAERQQAQTEIQDLLNQKEKIIADSARDLDVRKVGMGYAIWDNTRNKAISNEDVSIVYPSWTEQTQRMGSVGDPKSWAFFGSRGSAENYLDTLKRNGVYSNISSEDASRMADMVQRATDLENKYAGAEPVPDMPFKGEAWKKLLMRQAIKTAVEDGKDSIGWTTGQQQADRYNLATVIQSLHYERDPETGLYRLNFKRSQHGNFEPLQIGSHTAFAAEDLPDIIGKELANKIVNAEGHLKDAGSFKGLDLKVGGEGMKGFYDRELVNIANDIGKKFGAKVQDAQIQTKEPEWQVEGRERPRAQQAALPGFEEIAPPPRGWEFVGGEPIGREWGFAGTAHDRADAENAVALRTRQYPSHEWRAVEQAAPPPETIHELPITPQMRESVQTSGQPMFMPATHVLTGDALTEAKGRADETAARALAATGDIAKTNVQRVLDDKGSLEKNAERLADWLPKERRSRNPVQQIQNGIAFFKDKLVNMARAALDQPWALPASKQYQGYNIRAHDLAGEFEKKPETVMLGESGLSPNTSPEQSFEAARRLMKMLRDNSDDYFDDKMADWARNAETKNDEGEVSKLYSDADIRYLLGRKFSDIPQTNLAQAKWLRAFDEVYHPDRDIRVIRPDGTLGDYDRTATGAKNSFAWTTFDHMQNGIDALQESRPIEEILSSPKVANYYMSKLLAFENSRHVVVDTHHTSAAFGSSLPSSHEYVKKTFPSSRGGPEQEFAGLYSIIHEATLQAADEFGMDPKEFQAMIWSYQRGSKSPLAFGRGAEGKAAVKEIQDLWTAAARGKISEKEANEETERITNEFHEGKIPEPAYYGKPPRGEVSPPAGVSGEPAELPARGGVSAGGAGRGVGGDIAEGTAEGAGGLTYGQEQEGFIRQRSYNVRDPDGRTRFREALERAAADHPRGAAVEVKDPAFYEDPETKLFQTRDGLGGVAVSKDGDLVSVFKHPDSKEPILPVLQEAASHASTLDAYDLEGYLPELYAKLGFRPVARVKFDPALAPANWDRAQMDEPDNLLMARTGKSKLGKVNLPDVSAPGSYESVKDQIPLVSYERAKQLQQRAKEEGFAWRRRQTPLPTFKAGGIVLPDRSYLVGLGSRINNKPQLKGIRNHAF